MFARNSRRRGLDARRPTSTRCATIVATTVALVLGSANLADAHPGTGATDSWTFERDAVGAVPAGCSTPSGKTPITVTDELAHRSRHSLELNDHSATAQPVVSCSQPTQQGGQLTFWVDPEAVPNGYLIDLTGTTTAGPGVAFHLLFRGDGSIAWYDGGRWLPVAQPGAVPLHRWSQVGIGATTDQDMVYISANGRTLGTGGPWGINPVTSLTGFQFASAGTAPVGDRVYFDDIEYRPALLNRPKLITDQYRIGDLTTIETSSTPVQMPNTAVRVPLAHHRERILMAYPAHADAGNAAGNQLEYSDDGGKHWTDYQAHNPMPDAPSTYLTKLADGSLIAINYHTYTGPQQSQSVVESAVSIDNGATWTNRSGLLTAPVDMAPYACERPTGCALMVLVHNVIEDPDGTLYQSAYGKYVGDPKYRQVLLVSHDHGVNWSVQATVAVDPTLSSGPAYEGPCEGVLVRTGKHSFLIIMRTGSYLPMYAARSTDDGKSWSAPEQMKTRNGQPVSSVFPALERLGDGSLLLMPGRPGLSLMRSFDNGTTWSDQTWIDYTNSANGYMLPMGGNTVMMFGDRGADWGHPLQYAVWNRTVTAVGKHHGH